MRPIRTTEVSTLSQCERKWWYRYDQGIDEPFTSDALTLGTLFHAWWAEWWATPGGYNDINIEGVLDRIPDDRSALISQETAITANWMIQRYDEVYGPERDGWEMVENEIEMEATVAGLLLQGRADGLIYEKATQSLWLAECKTMKDWRRLDILTVDPQITHYYTLAKATGRDIEGVLYDAAKTYRWKRDEHPPADSFQRLYLDRSPEQCAEGLKELHAFNERRSSLVHPIRNISGFTCSGCAYKTQCWDSLAFPETTLEWAE